MILKYIYIIYNHKIKCYNEKNEKIRIFYDKGKKSGRKENRT
jgi:hypothetical protein